ncbi:uncharacterized protein PHALS_08929 [Plasmopara halstedii]|uniref:Uncharacterized protein n=1 Tax=Plasmopara halstedii TaxID=4781 RepID=A0A0P1ADD0_PLAHL|nr:uncharacterized protein PHALS_08929 [Plasmopara halstedii]CEG38882.1 hypothetical protein PHALS_08929 [Plasmopara halstedii]|eukprot:XP_024575251.1 hypothetical protein PHALS_08929 [Plasmopara halstedii]
MAFLYQTERIDSVFGDIGAHILSLQIALKFWEKGLEFTTNARFLRLFLIFARCYCILRLSLEHGARDTQHIRNEAIEFESKGNRADPAVIHAKVAPWLHWSRCRGKTRTEVNSQQYKRTRSHSKLNGSLQKPYHDNAVTSHSDAKLMLL